MLNLKNTLLKEYFDPSIERSIRVSLALVLPILWGILTGDMAIIWIAIGAQICAMVDIDGSFPLRILIISITILSCAVTGFLGTLAGNHWIWATAVMLLLGFLGGFVRQSGTHGIGMAIGALLIYLLALQNPGDFSAALHTFTATLIGGLLALALAIVSWLPIPFSPFKRTISNTWKAMSEWLALFPAILDEETDEDHPNLLDEKELDFREVLNLSIQTLSREQGLSHAKKNKLSFYLVELRKIISLINPAVSSLQDRLKTIKIQEDFPSHLTKYIFENLAQATERIAICIASNRIEYIYLVKLNIKRLKHNKALLLESLPKENAFYLRQPSFQSLDDTINYLEEAVAILEKMTIKTGKTHLFMRNLITGMSIPQNFPVIRIQLNYHSFAFRYALRVALSMGIGIAIYEIFHIPHGYWIAMTTMIVLQPDYGATFKKAFRRIKGTTLGVIIGSLVFLIPMPLYISFSIVTISSFFMSYYMKKNYGLAAFFITIMVIAIYHLIEPTSWQLGLGRLLNTLGGAGLALLGGYAFFPLWEQYRYPTLFKKAILSNKDYFEMLLSSTEEDLPNKMNFMGPRRESEVSNFNAFQSLNRMKEEPHKRRHHLQLLYVIIGYNIRLTRLLKTLNQELTKTSHLSFEDTENFRTKAVLLLEKTAEKISTIPILESSKPDLPQTSLVDDLNEMIPSIQNTDSEEQALIKSLYERIAKQIIGMYFSVYQTKPIDKKEINLS